jgi:hypothetical protein
VKLLEYFIAFLRDTVNLNQSRLDDLDGRVDSITAALRNAADLDGLVLDTVPQGSWAHETIIRPAEGLEFDADFLVQIEEDAGWNADPKRYATAVWNALYNHGTYGTMATRKDRCVRVTYANDCHIDVVPYVVLESGREVIVNRTTNEFEDTNPVGFTEWLQDKDAITNGNLRRVLRLLKYLRDQCNAFSIKSVLLTTLVGELVTPLRAALSPDCYSDTPSTLVTIVQDLDSWLQTRPNKPPLADPSCPTTSFDHRWTDAQYAAFRDRIHALAPKIRAAYDETTAATSLTAWQDVFGTSFKAPTIASGAAEEVAKAAWVDRADRAPQEDFIDEKFPVAVTHDVHIDCEVSEPNYPNRTARRRALRSRHGRVPKKRDLLFKVVSTTVPEPYEVHWKVRNHGIEAALENQLRGKIEPDTGQRQRRESTSYRGHHFVDCYIVKNDVCVAMARQQVVID